MSAYQDIEVVPTVSGKYMVLVRGLQWGPPGARRDRAGAADTEFDTEKEARTAFASSEAAYYDEP